MANEPRHGYIYTLLDDMEMPVYVGMSVRPHERIHEMIYRELAGREVTNWLRGFSTKLYIPAEEVYNAWYNREDKINWPDVPNDTKLIKWRVIDEATFDSPFPIGTLSNHIANLREQGFTLFNKQRGRKNGYTALFMEVKKANSNEEKIAIYQKEINRLRQEIEKRRSY